MAKRIKVTKNNKAKTIKTNTRAHRRHFLGVRVELPSYLATKIDQRYHKLFCDALISPPENKIKIVSDSSRGFIYIKTIPDDKTKYSIFSIGLELKLYEIERLVGIINVLGDDKLIREKVCDFMDRKSSWSLLPELSILSTVFKNLATLVPRFADRAWVYAPEIITK